MHGLEAPFDGLPHLDLLIGARRVFKLRMGRVNLGNEPPAMWPALEAALRLARAHVKGATRRVKVPGHVDEVLEAARALG